MGNVSIGTENKRQINSWENEMLAWGRHTEYGENNNCQAKV
jgi:hypothetical protein